MVFRCPTCGRFIKAKQAEGDGEFGTCGKCKVDYIAHFSGCITESGCYDAWVTVWPCPNQTRGKEARWILKVDL